MRGIIADYEALPWKVIGTGVKYKPVLVNGLGASLVSFDAGSTHARHSHDEVQIAFCLEGRMEFYIKDSQSERSEVMSPGKVMALQPHVVHGGRAIENSMLLVIWNPMTRFAADAVVRLDN